MKIHITTTHPGARTPAKDLPAEDQFRLGTMNLLKIHTITKTSRCKGSCQGPATRGSVPLRDPELVKNGDTSTNAQPWSAASPKKD